MSNQTCEHHHKDARHITTNDHQSNAKNRMPVIQLVNNSAPRFTLAIGAQATDYAVLTNNSFAINADLLVTSRNLMIPLDRQSKTLPHFGDQPITEKLSVSLADSPDLPRTQKMRAGASRPVSEIQEVTLGRSGVIATATSHKHSCRPSKTSARSTPLSSACEFDR